MGAFMEAKAAQCEAYFDRTLPTGHCHCFPNNSTHNAKLKIEDMMRKQNPSTEMRYPAQTARFGGGVAVILRGHAFRGSAHDSMSTRKAAQLECSDSIQRHIVSPFVQLGVRVHAYMVVYDTIDGTMLQDLTRAYQSHVVAVTTLSSKVAGQVVGLANAILAFDEVRKQRGFGRYDAVVALRLDLRLKADLAPYLLDGTSLQEDASHQRSGGSGGMERRKLPWLTGIRFAWREIGGDWRSAWFPTAQEFAAAPSLAVRKDMERVSYHMQKVRDATFQPHHWMLNDRVPDTLMVWGGEFTRCLLGDVMLETTRNWKPHEPTKWHVQNDVGHRLLWQLRNALATGIPREVDPNTSTPVGYLPWLGYLVRNGSFDSNPCRATCILNPLYDILPRQLWTVRSQMCTDPAKDFIFDNRSRSICCPAADYCCPNSIANCSDPRHTRDIQLFDAAGVSDAVLGAEGWLRHFASRHRYLSRANPKICGHEGYGTVGCARLVALTVTPASVERIQALWNASPWMPENDLPEDDDNCRIPHLGRCAAERTTAIRDVLGF